jgi:hypothetical protein
MGNSCKTPDLIVTEFAGNKCSSEVIFEVIDELVTSCLPCISIFAEIRARSIFRHFGGHFENHSQIGNSGSSVTIHLVGIYFCAKFG